MLQTNAFVFYQHLKGEKNIIIFDYTKVPFRIMQKEQYIILNLFFAPSNLIHLTNYTIECRIGSLATKPTYIVLICFYKRLKYRVTI